MPHCNDRACTRSIRWEGDERLCACTCSTCEANASAPGRGRKTNRGVCAACAEPAGPADEFCEKCGAPIDELARAAATRRVMDQSFERNSHAAAAAHGVERGSRMIGTLSIVFFVSGGFAYVVQRETANKALRNLSSYEGNAVITVEGTTYEVASLRRQIEAQPAQLLSVNLLLALIMVGLWFWSSKKPLPAIATALSTFVVVNFVNFLIDPKTLLQGLIIKVAAFAALGAGLKSALAAQASEQSA